MPVFLSSVTRCLSPRLWLLLSVFLCPLAWAKPPTWILIDGATRTLAVKRGERVLASFENISWGRGGLGKKQRVGDGVTPVGEFRIAWVNPNSNFHLFFGFDYPNTDYALQGLLQGDISERAYQRIVSAIEAGKAPPQNTPLGGQVGIHGIGKGDPWVHENMNWTWGCVALSNQQIDALRPWVNKGMRVVIQGE